MRNTTARFDIGRSNVFQIYDYLKNTTARRFDASYVRKTTTACQNTLIWPFVDVFFFQQMRMRPFGDLLLFVNVWFVFLQKESIPNLHYDMSRANNSFSEAF